GGAEYVRLPDHLPVAGELPLLGVVPERAREPWTVSFREDLLRTAEEIDELLKKRPDIRNRNWVRRMETLRFGLADPDTGDLRYRPEKFTIDGVEHIVGLMNSGKTTLTDLI